MNDKVVLGIHSNIDPRSEAGLTSGHAWISVTQNGRTQTFGLWPDEHPVVQSQGQSNGDGSDIRRGIESGLGRNPAASRYYALAPDQFRALLGELGKSVHWGYTNTCASWASEVTSRVTGERVNASELLGITDTPRELSQSIQELERCRQTAPDKPLNIDEVTHHSSSFSQAEGGISLNQHPVALAIRDRLPASVSDERVALAAVLAVDAGIDRPGKLAGALERDGSIHVAGTTPGFRVTLDAAQPQLQQGELTQRLAAQIQVTAEPAIAPQNAVLRMS